MDAIAIPAILVLNAAIGFVQEYRAERALEALKVMAAFTATVLREGVATAIPAAEFVPGEVVLLVDRGTEPLREPGLPLGERTSVAYKGTIVTYGGAAAWRSGGFGEGFSPSGAPRREIFEIAVSGRGFDRLVTFIQEAHARDEAGRAIPLGPGQYGNSRFYLAREKYFLLKTCNTWTARALRAAGAPITPLYALTAGNVMSQARAFGTPIGSE